MQLLQPCVPRLPCNREQTSATRWSQHFINNQPAQDKCNNNTVTTIGGTIEGFKEGWGQGQGRK